MTKIDIHLNQVKELKNQIKQEIENNLLDNQGITGIVEEYFFDVEIQVNENHIRVIFFRWDDDQEHKDIHYLCDLKGNLIDVDSFYDKYLPKNVRKTLELGIAETLLQDVKKI